MTDTPISLLKIILEEVETECTCTRRFGRGYQMAAAGQGEGTCLHCRIKALVGSPHAEPPDADRPAARHTSEEGR